MARPVDDTLPVKLLDDVLEAVARIGLGSLSLRALARELLDRSLKRRSGGHDGLAHRLFYRHRGGAA